MIRDSFAEPQETADRILAMRPSTGVVVQAAVLVSALDALILGLLDGGSFVVPTPEGDIVLPPLLHAAMLLGSVILSAGALQVGGQILGGKGRFQESLLLVVWLDVLAIAIQAVTLVLAMILPPVAGIVAIVGFVILLWCVVQFTRVLHGFPGYGRTIAALLLGGLAMVIGLSVLLATLGFGGPADV